MTGCRYITSLDKPCGRTETHGRYCRFHAVLHEFETDPCKLLNATVNDLYDAIGALNR